MIGRFDVNFDLEPVDSDDPVLGTSVWDAEVDVQVPALTMGATAAAQVAGGPLDALLVAVRRALDKLVADGGGLPAVNDLDPWVQTMNSGQPDPVQSREDPTMTTADPRPLAEQLTLADLWNSLQPASVEGNPTTLPQAALISYALRSLTDGTTTPRLWQDQIEQIVKRDRDCREQAQ